MLRRKKSTIEWNIPKIDIKGSKIANKFARTVMDYGVEGRGVLDIDTLIDDLFYKNYTLKEYTITWKIFNLGIES